MKTAFKLLCASLLCLTRIAASADLDAAAQSKVDAKLKEVQ
jgi:hypothetical protein